MEADALSQIPRSDHTILDVPTVKAIMNVVPYTDWTEYNLDPTNLVCKSTQIIVHKKSRDDWKEEQENDSIIGPVIQAMKNKNTKTGDFNDESKRLFRS